MKVDWLRVYAVSIGSMYVFGTLSTLWTEDRTILTILALFGLIFGFFVSLWSQIK